MEYLMTYGWAILIIAVVLAVLFQLGVFSGGNFTPKAQPGSCQVSRTVAGVSLEGQCDGMLPQFVMSQNGTGYAYASLTSWFGNNNPLTATEWTYVSPSDIGPTFGLAQSPPDSAWCMTTMAVNGISSTIYGRIWGPGYLTDVVSTGWHFIAMSYNPTGLGTVSLYVDGGLANTITGQYTPSGATVYWTTYEGCQNMEGGNGHLIGMLSNIQAYNTTLSSAEIQALYLEGIGGAPIRPQNIIGWWPLNGNLNDYSGNDNAGVNGGVSFSSSWESGYSAP